MIQQAKTILKETFGYDTYRPLQQEVIKKVLGKKDTLVIMPTGGGKSLCYQIPALLFDGITIVVSPLISLMKDQVEQLHEYGVPALFLNSSLTPEQYKKNVARLKTGEVKLLYLAPETLMMPATRTLLASLTVDCFTIDEAHCISEWGHDFRPDYRQLADIRKDFPEAVCLALTATATPRVREDIKTILELRDSETFIASFDRKNLLLKIADKQNPLDQILDFLYTRKGQSGIIYCFSRRQVDELADDLKSEGYSVLPYHAGLSERDRTANQEAFIKDNVSIIVATIAFGMGINKPDVRYVIHHDMPQNIESYYQQIGRAGRDGVQSDCLLLYSYSDTQKIKYFINQKEDNEKIIAQKHLDALVKYLEHTGCRRVPLMDYFGEKYQNDNCKMCDNCLALEGDREDLTTAAQKMLSCAVRTGERFGGLYLADVLRGSKSKKVLENNHDSVSTYGIGMELSKDQWVQLSRLLIRQGYFTKDADYGSLVTTSEANAVLQGKTRVEGILDRTQTSVDKSLARTSSDVENKFDELLFEELRKLRKKLADEKDIPPYVIFPDTSLMEMAYYFPRQEENFTGIYGVGAVKQKQYGKEFLKVIRAYCEEKGIEEKSREISRKVKKSSSGKKHEVVAEEYNSGKTIEHLAEEHGVKVPTILAHLKTWIDEGNDLSPAGVLKATELSERLQETVMKSMKKVGPDLLKPVYDDLNGEVSYNDLRVMQLYYLASKK